LEALSAVARPLDVFAGAFVGADDLDALSLAAWPVEVFFFSVRGGGVTTRPDRNEAALSPEAAGPAAAAGVATLRDAEAAASAADEARASLGCADSVAARLAAGATCPEPAAVAGDCCTSGLPEPPRE
jgi:hypothetical protein